jgi:cytochrome c oxidase subunit 2
MYILQDFPRIYQLGFQDTATPVMSAIVDLHSYILFFLIMIFVFVGFLIYDVLSFFRLDFLIRTYNFHIGAFLEKENRTFFLFSFYKLSNLFFNNILRLSLLSRLYKFTHHTILETIWTLVPVIIVISIAVPSFLLLYAIDVTVDTALTIKSIGHQWYWSFELEYPFLTEDFRLSFKRRIYDSYMVTDNDLILGQLRNLEVDNALLLPIKTHLDLIITADDVLHSFALPSLGIKIDAIPGRLNHTGIFLERPGVFYGQCSELCGTNHAFMPIKAYGMNYNSYVFVNDNNWNL